MNILFLTLAYISDLSERGIYTDLMREFIRHGHCIHIVVPAERRLHQPTTVIENSGAKILRVRTLNIQKTNLIEKGIGTLLLEAQYQYAINTYWKDIKFDLVLYSTPPITFNKVIETLKRKYKAKTYLLLKDIFPQNAVDLGMFSRQSLLYKFFRRKEVQLYQLSDYIGCMSQANVDYVLKHNTFIDAGKVEVCPNSIEVVNTGTLKEDKTVLFQRYNIPAEKLHFIYGGNLGRPQGVDFLLEVVAANEQREDSYIIIVGSGTEYEKIRLWFDTRKPKNACLYSSLPKQDYDALVSSCEIGLIFLDKRFTIPNYPSRLLSYLENKISVLIATDVNTDMGRIAESNGYGLWVESGNLDAFVKMIDFMTADRSRVVEMGEKGYTFLMDNYTVQNSYKVIMKHFN